MNNDEQINYWNTTAGLRWQQQANYIDYLLSPFNDVLLNKIQINADNTKWLDIGCGAAALTLAAAQQLPTQASITGMDVSKPLLQLAQERATHLQLNNRLQFLLADASSHSLDEPADIAISRFGVMFFDDPVSAFSNIRANLKKNGQLCFACWQPMRENEWLLAPLQTVLPLLKEQPNPMPANAPGPFGLADREYTKGILEQSGWSDICIEPYQHDIRFPDESIEKTVDFLIDFGPLSRVLATQEVNLVALKQAISTMIKQRTDAKAPLTLASAAWIITARNN